MLLPQSPTPINGLVALEASFLVALKQLVPEHTVSLFRGIIKMRIKHFPVVFVLANMISGPLLGTDTALWLSLFGFFTGWIYLRFYRKSEITTATTGDSAFVKGDASDTFGLTDFFPDPIAVVLGPIADSVYNILVQLKVCTPFSDEAVEQGNESSAARSDGGLPNIMHPRGGAGRREEAERRRALALKALDQRLHAAASRPASTPTPANGSVVIGEAVDEAVPVKEPPAPKAAHA